ncbi:exodeoxyribonuclease VII large subunit [Aestuariibius sp. HNIBRBA575]|uniref:exodeoxyribonuclease VII large subunit n=1 Tax=Aestuariibius sp. HNIBRBA575 TaxID=3233343 RepID=UPI0034A58951
MSDLFDDPIAGQNTPEFTVSELSGAVKRTIEGEFSYVRVKAEVGRVMHARSGHLYFDLKDDRSVLACTTWKGQVSGLSVVPEEGMEVVVSGKMTTFGNQSKYQLNAVEVTVAGVGALMAMLEKRKKALAAEGLFDEDRKKKLPYLPEIIGVVTSPSGAVIRDILHRLRDRFPRKVLVWPVAVQGQACSGDVANAINGFNKMTPGGALPRPDLIIVARGGGSIEDLWGFNEEVVARATAASDIPIISAVGHETDTTLIDFVSDQRAPTPTAAAELAVPVRRELMAWVDEQGARLTRGLNDALTRREQRLRDVARALPKPETLLQTSRQRLDVMDHRLPNALMSTTDRKRLKLQDKSGPLRPGILMAKLQQSQRDLAARDQRLAPALSRIVERRNDRLDQWANRMRPQLVTDRMTRFDGQIKDVAGRLKRPMDQTLSDLSNRLMSLDRLRETLGYRETIKRGYAVVRGDGNVITDTKTAKKATNIEVEFADGRIALGSTEPAKSLSKKPNPKPPAAPKPDQGSLF